MTTETTERSEQDRDRARESCAQHFVAACDALRKAEEEVADSREKLRREWDADPDEVFADEVFDALLSHGSAGSTMAALELARQEASRFAPRPKQSRFTKDLHHEWTGRAKALEPIVQRLEPLVTAQSNGREEA